MSTEPDVLVHEVSAPRSANGREWELFVSESPDDPLTHAGSVTAPSREAAVEQAARMFGWTAETVWLCPADDVIRVMNDERALVNR